MKKNRKASAIMIAGMIGLTGLTVVSGVSEMGTMTVHAEENTRAASEYVTRGGIATMGTGSASITINGQEGQTLVGKKFNVYKLFYAENARDGESINYTFNPLYEQALKNVTARALSKDGKQVNAVDVTEYMVIDYIQTLNTNPVEGTQTEQELEGRYSLFRYFVEDLRDEIESLKLQADVVTVNSVLSDNSIRLSGLDYGYYIIDEVSNVQGTHSASSLCMVDTANPSATIGIKSDYPSIVKKIQEDDAASSISDKDRWNDIADYEIGQTVPYRFESNVSDMNGYDTYYYAWHDRMDEALTFQPQTVSIVIKGSTGSGSKEYTLQKSEFSVITDPDESEDTFQVEIKDIKAIVDREFNQMNGEGENLYGQTVVLRYDAVLNDLAAKDTGRPGFENDVCLEFSNDADSNGEGSTGRTPWDTVVCFTYQLDVQKINNHDKSLADAKFRLYFDEDCSQEVYVKEGENGYIVINRDSAGGNDHEGGSRPAEAVEMTSSEDGTFIIYGLDGNTTYYLKETDAPDGYRPLLDPIILKITSTYTTDRDQYIKGDSATNKTLQKLEATAHIQSFYDGITKQEDQSLTTDVENGSINLTVINEVGKKLPVTGTSVVVILTLAGACLMGSAVVLYRKRGKKENE